MGRLVHFEIAADSPERAAEFYRKVFDWEIQKWEGPQPYWLITTGPEDKPGINGGIWQREQPLTGNEGLIAYRCTIDVASVDDAVKKVTENGGKVIVPKVAVPGVGWLAFCNDTESNIFGMMQSDESAK
ncbi:MAG TPA: VOC family protein [Candidatus Subteraquimicrobiales bacterium]